MADSFSNSVGLEKVLAILVFVRAVVQKVLFDPDFGGCRYIFFI